MQSMLKRSAWSVQGAGLVLVLLALVAGPAWAQVPQDMTFTGRLVDGGGTPLASPVTFDLWIYDDATLGTPGSANALYAERHGPVTLDANGNFSVLLGSGADCTACPGFPFPPFDPALFSDVERHVEVVLILPTAEFLTPRVPIASVPWAFVAQQANEIVPDPNAPRFEDCGDGTLADHMTGLQWEKKTGTLSPPPFNICSFLDCPDPHDVNNQYSWSVAADQPNGAAFQNFLARLNGEFDPDAATGCFADHCDWELPKISELQTILIGPEAAPNQSAVCPAGSLCIDPDFDNIGGPTAYVYWSDSTNNIGGVPGNAWGADFGNGDVWDIHKSNAAYVRAVRAGSCN